MESNSLTLLSNVTFSVFDCLLLELQVEVMQRELQDLQPILAKTAKEVEDMMVVITNDKKEADLTKASVEKQEKDANQQAAKAKGEGTGVGM